jgi:hypothetical protein
LRVNCLDCLEDLRYLSLSWHVWLQKSLSFLLFLPDLESGSGFSQYLQLSVIKTVASLL